MQKPPDSKLVLVNVQELDWPVPSYYTSQTTQTKGVSRDYHPLPKSKIQPACLLLRSSQQKMWLQHHFPACPTLHHSRPPTPPWICIARSTTRCVLRSEFGFHFYVIGCDRKGVSMTFCFCLCDSEPTNFVRFLWPPLFWGKLQSPEYAFIQMWEIGLDWINVLGK